MRETVISHLVKPEDLQHHGTLFAGRMAEWLVESCFITACRLVGKPEDVVCVRVHGISFTKPVTSGNIIEIKARIALVGDSSITVYGQAFNSDEETTSVTGMATFVTVDKQGRPYAHGFSLSAEYIAQNREIYDEALKVRGQG
ncbi:MAG: hotdog domain-containing protein [Dehalococcoidales bacterium]|nr:hotdog domain-containing protein [Dehalococcoidales bacterium]